MYVLCATSRNDCSLTLCGVGQAISINILPDHVLLAVFDFCVNHDVVGDPIFEHIFAKFEEDMVAWQSLIHVCRRWRGIIFGSPRRLNLRLVCTSKPLASNTLNLWPTLPLLVHVRDRVSQTEDVDNVVAVLKCRDRVNEIYLYDVNSSQLEKVLAVLQEPFPELTHLLLRSNGAVPVLPDSFLGGSASRLRLLWLERIPFPALPKLLLSATHLVSLRLHEIPHSGYISPEAIVATLSTLANLRSLSLKFLSPLSRPNWASRRPPPKTRIVLPALTHIRFEGVSEYLDNLVAPIDVPRLSKLFITFFNQILFDTPQFILFIKRTPMLKALGKARIAFGDHAVKVQISSEASSSPYEVLDVKILCTELDWQVSSLEQIFIPSFPPLSTLEELYVFQAPHSHPHWQDNLENTLWLELLHRFSTVKNLYLCEKFAPRIGSAFEELVMEETTEVLPTLQNIILEGLQTSGFYDEGIAQFVGMRGYSRHPVDVFHWDDSVLDKALRG